MIDGPTSTNGATAASAAASSSSSSSTPQPAQNHTSSSGKTGIIAGAIVGGIAAIALAIVAIVFLLKRKSLVTPPPASQAEYTGAANQLPPSNGNNPAMAQAPNVRHSAAPPYQQNGYFPAGAGMQQDYKFAAAPGQWKPDQGVQAYAQPAPAPMTPQPQPYPQAHEMYGGAVHAPIELPGYAR